MKLKKALGLILPKYKEPSVCQACGNEFVCGASLNGCWCMEVKVGDEARSEMKTKFSDCLCRECLEGYARRGERS